MRTITINKKIRLWLLSGLLLLPFPATAEILPQIALYHHPKYEHDFTHFDYADPQARKGGRIVMPEYGGGGGCGGGRNPPPPPRRID